MATEMSMRFDELARHASATLHLRHLFQDGADGGGVLTTEAVFHRLEINAFGCIEYRRRHADLACVVADHLHVFVPHGNLHGDVVVAAFGHHRCPQLEDSRITCTGRHEIDNHSRIEAGFHPENHCLRGGDIVDGNQQVGDVFHAAAVAKCADIEDLTAESHQHWTQLRDGWGIATGIENKVAVLRLRPCAADRTIDHDVASLVRHARSFFLI